MSNMSLNICPDCGAYTKPNDFYCHTCGATISVKPRVAAIKGYIQIIGAVEIVFGILAIIGGVFFGLLAAFVPRLIMMEDFSTHMDPDFPEFLNGSSLPIFAGILLGMIALLLIIYAIASIVSGAKLLQYKNSGRIGTMIIAAFNLFGVPVGTLLGLATLYVLTRPEAEQLFSSYSRKDTIPRYYQAARE
ncbi:MAG: hypothetical protein ACFFD4_09150 [Candidatus Odinarchaeota archaeon]